MAKRFISLGLFLWTALFCLSCAPLKTDDVLTEGVSQYSQGKVEKDYQLDNSGRLLAELIDNYADSYYHPSASKLSDDEFENLFGIIDGFSENNDENISDDDVSEDISQELPSDYEIVSNINDLERVFYSAYKNTEINVMFEVADSYVFKMEDLEIVYENLQNQDPISASGVESWLVYSYGNKIYVQNQYFFSTDELKRMKQETYQLVSDAAKEINAYGLDDCSIVCNVNDYLCDNTYYPDAHPYYPPYDPITHTAYGCLEDGCAVCEGYSCAAKLLLNEFGVECQIEVGDCIDGGGHAWNLVKVDGNWYQLDVTWNDGSGSDDYLLVTDDYMRKTRVWDYSKYPSSSNTSYPTGR